MLIPPVEFHCRRNAELRQPSPDSQRHQEQRRAALLSRQHLHAVAVEVIVMIVRDQHDVDVRQVLRCNAWRLRASRSDELHRRGTPREYGIRQYVQPARLHQHRRMADPSHRGNHRGAGQGIAPDEIQIGCLLRRRQCGFRRQIVANPLKLPAQHIAERFGDRPDVVVAKAPRRVMEFRRHRQF
jgi:hypothetical protein